MIRYNRWIDRYTSDNLFGFPLFLIILSFGMSIPASGAYGAHGRIPLMLNKCKLIQNSNLTV